MSYVWYIYCYKFHNHINFLLAYVQTLVRCYFAKFFGCRTYCFRYVRTNMSMAGLKNQLKNSNQTFFFSLGIVLYLRSELMISQNLWKKWLLSLTFRIILMTMSFMILPIKQLWVGGKMNVQINRYYLPLELEPRYVAFRKVFYFYPDLLLEHDNIIS